MLRIPNSFREVFEKKVLSSGQSILSVFCVFLFMKRNYATLQRQTDRLLVFSVFLVSLSIARNIFMDVNVKVTGTFY